MLRLQSYDYTVRHVPGKKNIADVLSRLPYDDNQTASDGDEEAVRLVAQAAAPSAIGVHEVERVSANDDELTLVRECIRQDTLEKLPSEYKNVRYELTVLGKLVLRGQRLVIPHSLRQQTVCLAHEGHQGISKTKERLRSKVWWPGMDRDAEKVCRSCHACQVTGPPAPPPLVKTTPLPEGPWQSLAVDLLGPLSGGEYLLVLVDYYSRYFEVDMVKTTKTEIIIQC